MKRFLALGLTAGAAASLVTLKRARTPADEPQGGVFIHDAWIDFVERGSGPAIVLVHGFGGSMFSWRDVVPALAESHRVVALDLPGFGWSDRNPALDLSPPAQARRVVALMDHLGISSASVVGHSMGGGVAQWMALQHPERVERLVLVATVDAGSPARGAPRNPILRELLGLGMRASASSGRLVTRTIRRSLESMAYDPAAVTAEVVRGYTDPLLRPGTAACLSAMARASRDAPLASLQEIARPTLVIAGEVDRVIPLSTTRRVADNIPGARHVVLPEAGHIVPDEAPAALSREILEFVGPRTA